MSWGSSAEGTLLLERWAATISVTRGSSSVGFASSLISRFLWFLGCSCADYREVSPASKDDIDSVVSNNGAYGLFPLVERRRLNRAAARYPVPAPAPSRPPR